MFAASTGAFDCSWIPFAHHIAALSIVTVWNNAQPSSQFFGPTAHVLATTWTVMSMCLNMILTILIVVRLLIAKRRLAGALGKEHGVSPPITYSAIRLIGLTAPVQQHLSHAR